MPNPASTGLPNPSNYTVDAGVVTDNVTELMWQLDLPNQPYDWVDANGYCRTLSLGGYEDWRLPTRIELASLVDYTVRDPAIDATAFPAASSAWFFTSSPGAASPSEYWLVEFVEGSATFNILGSSVRCVRSAPVQAAPPPGRYLLEGQAPNDTVTDTVTGLVWQRTLSASSYTWADATNYCTALGASWRVPSVKELLTIVDESRSNPAIDTTVFPATPNGWLWTSSGSASSPGDAWYVDFYHGTTYRDGKASSSRVRCVR
jgi:hypothetical protein